MRMIALVTAFLVGLIAPGLAQQAEIEAVNAKWIDFFNKGDFAGIALLYTEDATALPRAPPQQRAELRLRSCGKAWRSKWAIRSSLHSMLSH
jgi:ketosteroid isomerase-like protein